jgi:hypothetical protein
MKMKIEIETEGDHYAVYINGDGSFCGDSFEAACSYVREYLQSFIMH